MQEASIDSSVAQRPEPLEHPTLGAADLYDVAALSDIGNERENNEDSIGFSYVGGASLILVVADGVGGYEGGELASHKAVDVTLQSYREQARSIAPEKRLYRAAQQANIEIYDQAIVVPELRGMSSTMTAVVLEGAMLHAAHVGDSRLYRVRSGAITQLTKDHTVTAERVRQKLMSAERARQHPDRGTLTRSLGRELIVAVDRITLPVQSGDILIVCTDGMYNVLGDEEIAALSEPGPAEAIAARLIATANEKGTYDNLSAAVCRVVGDLPAPRETKSWRKRLNAWLRSGA